MSPSSHGRGRPLAAPGARMEVTEGPKGTNWWDKGEGELVTEVNGTREFVDFLSAQKKDTLVVVDFYARWCNACKALHPKLLQLAEDGKAAGNVVFVRVNYDDNRAMCKGLNVKVLPYFQLYKGPLGKVTELSASLNKVQKLRDAIAEHQGPL